MENFEKLRDPREFLTSSILKTTLPGTKFQVKFEIPYVEDELDGKVTNLSGNIPFLLGYEEYPEVKFYGLLESEQRKWAVHYYAILNEIKSEMKDVFIEKSLEKSEARCIFALLTVLIFSPDYAPNSKKFELAFRFIVIAFILDDMFDSSGIQSYDVSLNLTEIWEISEELQNGSMAALYKLDEALAIPNLKHPFKLIEKIFKEVGAEIPGIQTNLKYFWKRVVNLMLMSHAPYSKEREVFLKQRSYVCGIDIAVEMKASSLGIKLDDKVREVDVFEKMMRNYNVMCVILNDVIGLHLDKKKHPGLLNQDNSILRKRDQDGLDIGTAFQDTMDLFHENHKSVVSMMDSLETQFPNEKSLFEYLNIMKEIYDGLIWTYFGHGEYRYGQFGGKYLIELVKEG